MKPVASEQDMIIRTSRGLTIAGTRITIYAVLDYIKSDWPRDLIQQWLNLSDVQMNGVLEYIDMHRNEVEAEYEHVVQTAEENRRYWEDRTKEQRERAAQKLATSDDPIHVKLRERMKALGLS